MKISLKYMPKLVKSPIKKKPERITERRDPKVLDSLE
jgi:hypothetical protein